MGSGRQQRGQRGGKKTVSWSSTPSHFPQPSALSPPNLPSLSFLPSLLLLLPAEHTPNTRTRLAASNKKSTDSSSSPGLGSPLDLSERGGGGNPSRALLGEGEKLFGLWPQCLLISKWKKKKIKNLKSSKEASAAIIATPPREPWLGLTARPNPLKAFYERQKCIV